MFCCSTFFRFDLFSAYSVRFLCINYHVNEKFLAEGADGNKQIIILRIFLKYKDQQTLRECYSNLMDLKETGIIQET
jgi:hypothetical protein